MKVCSHHSDSSPPAQRCYTASFLSPYLLTTSAEFPFGLIGHFLLHFPYSAHFSLLCACCHHPNHPWCHSLPPGLLSRPWFRLVRSCTSFLLNIQDLIFSELLPIFSLIAPAQRKLSCWHHESSCPPDLPSISRPHSSDSRLPLCSAGVITLNTVLFSAPTYSTSLILPFL